MSERFLYSCDTARPITLTADVTLPGKRGVQFGIGKPDMYFRQPTAPTDGVTADYNFNEAEELERDWICHIYPQIDPETHCLIRNGIYSLDSAVKSNIENALTPIPDAFYQVTAPSLIMRSTAIPLQIEEALPYLVVSGMVNRIAINARNKSTMIPDLPPNQAGRRKGEVTREPHSVLPKEIAALFPDQEAIIGIEMDATKKGQATVIKEIATILQEAGLHGLTQSTEKRIRSLINLTLRFQPKKPQS